MGLFEKGLGELRKREARARRIRRRFCRRCAATSGERVTSENGGRQRSARAGGVSTWHAGWRSAGGVGAIGGGCEHATARGRRAHKILFRSEQKSVRSGSGSAGQGGASAQNHVPIGTDFVRSVNRGSTGSAAAGRGRQHAEGVGRKIRTRSGQEFASADVRMMGAWMMGARMIPVEASGGRNRVAVWAGPRAGMQQAVGLAGRLAVGGRRSLGDRGADDRTTSCRRLRVALTTGSAA